MRKGLYWSQLLLGIGIGLIMVALVWIGIDEFYPGLIQPTFQQTVRPTQERRIVYYEYPYYEFDSPQLSIPQIDEGQLTDELAAEKKDEDQTKEDKTEVVNQPEKVKKEIPVDSKNLKDIKIDIPASELIASLLTKKIDTEPIRKEEAMASKEVMEFLKKRETDISNKSTESKEDKDSKESSKSTEWIEIKVSSGEPAWKIAGRLEKEGIIDRSKFLKIVEQMNLDKRLRVGTYRFKKDMNTFEVIAELLKISY